MATYTKRQFEEKLKYQALFEYWKLQNNPEYLQFFKESMSKIEDVEFEKINNLFWIEMPFLQYVKKKGEEVKKVGYAYITRSGKLLVTYRPLINPLKKIDWGHLSEAQIDNDFVSIMLRHFYSPISEALFYGSEEMDYRRGPFAKFSVDLRKHKREILNALSQRIDTLKRIRKIRTLNRDQIKKFHLYAQVWELRKILDHKKGTRLLFREIATRLSLRLPTVKSMFSRAYELLFSEPYDQDKYEIAMQKLSEKDRKICSDCPERPTCRGECPDMRFLLRQLEGKQPHRISKYYEDEEGELISTYLKASDREAFSKWQKEQREK